jgi:hypothetical protein
MSDVAPPLELTPDTYADRLYAMLEPLAERDFEFAWSLLILCNAIGVPFQLVEDLVRDTEEGVGWSVLLDLDRCPPEALPWLAQFVGVRLLAGSTESEQRARIASTDGFKRGTREALIGAAQATLTGARKVTLRERDGDKALEPIAYAYRLTVTTYASQTPDPAATLAALLAQKPGGLVLEFHTAIGQDYATVKSRFATYAALDAAYPDYLAVATDEP